MPEKGKGAEKQVRISAQLHRRLSIHAAKAGTSNAAIAERAIADYLKNAKT